MHSRPRADNATRRRPRVPAAASASPSGALPPTLFRAQATVRRVLARLEELERIETCGQMLPLSEINKLRNKPALQEELEELMRVCRGWWEADGSLRRASSVEAKGPAKRGSRATAPHPRARRRSPPASVRHPPYQAAHWRRRRRGPARRRRPNTKVSGGGFAALATTPTRTEEGRRHAFASYVGLDLRTT